MSKAAIIDGTICDRCWDETRTEVPAVKVVAGEAVCEAHSGSVQTRFEETTTPSEDASRYRMPRGNYGKEVPITSISAEDYRRKFGTKPKQKNPRKCERTMKLWAAVTALQGEDVLVLPCVMKNASVMRSALVNSLSRLAKEHASPFKIRGSANPQFKHVVIWKEDLEKGKHKP